MWRSFHVLAAASLNSRMKNVRELIVYSYRIIYRLQNNEAVIAAVVHAKRVL